VRRLIDAVAGHWAPLTLAVVAAVTLLSLWPDAGLQDATPGGDRLHHFLAYGAMACPVALARPRFWPLALVALAAWSWGIEQAQPLVGRANDAGDLAANMAGLALGVVAAAAARRLAR
jgi:VanZ family protein